MLIIRQNATHKVVIGPCVAVGDGFTPVTTLSLSTADEAEAILHDNGTVVSISAYTFAAITTADGYYHLTLQSGISGTVGHMTVVINDDSLCLPIRADFTVMEEAAYDAMYKSGAEGPLQGTTAGNTLDVTATGAAGIDWGNIENKTTANDLSGTDIQLVDTATTLTNLPSIPVNWITTAGITDGAFTAAKFAASSLDGKGDWNVGKTGYTLTQSFPTNFADMAITVTTGKVTAEDVTLATSQPNYAPAKAGDNMGTVSSVTGNVDGSVASVVADVTTDAASRTASQADVSSLASQASVDALNDVAATDIVSNGAITTLAGAVVNVDTVDTTTTNTDMRGTDDAALASVATEARLSELDAATGGKMANEVDVIKTEIGTAGAGLTDLGGMSTAMKAEVNAEADTAIADYDPPTNAEFEARTPTAAQLAYIVENAATGMPVTFTTSGGSTTAAVINQVDGASGSATDDQYNGRLLVFTNGTLKGVVTDITDYDGGTTTATITAIPFAPTASHTARLI